MRIFAIIIIGIILYLTITFFFYWIFNKIDPYDETTDYLGNGDVNIPVAFFWPLTIPILIIGMIIAAIVELMKVVCR
jgi:TRAP-type C4-dicarboxylate transport system permease large subunit